MLSRRTLFFLSFCVAVVLHALLFAIAPRVSMMRTFGREARVERLFKVEIREVQPPVPARAEEFVVASRPGSIRDLMQREEEVLLPEEPPHDAFEIPDLPDRLRVDPLTREYDLAREPGRDLRVDAKILEIAAEDARRDLEIPRRLVRPSPQRLLQEGEEPALRSPLALNDAPLRFDMPARSLLAETLADREALVPPERLEPPPPEPRAPDTRPVVELVEEQVARAPLQRAVESARAASGYTFIDDLVDIRLDTYVNPVAQEGFFRLRIYPKAGEDIGTLPKDVVFVVDASSSISQHKLNTTANGISRALQFLRPEDTFNIIVFRGSPERFRPEPLPALPEHKAEAERYLKALQSHGQTDVYQGILPVLESPVRQGAPSIAIVFSDGRPTTGLQDARLIINQLTAENDQRHSIFAYGGGRTVNRYLMDLLAYRNKGQAEVVSSVDQIARGFPEFMATLHDPLLTNLEANYGSIIDHSVAPRVLPDFYRGKAVTVYGRFKPGEAGEFVMRLTGEALDRRKELVFKADLEEAATGDPEIARQWAFQKSYDIIGEISRSGERPELLAELRQLSAAYNIRTAYSD